MLSGYISLPSIWSCEKICKNHAPGALFVHVTMLHSFFFVSGSIKKQRRFTSVFSCSKSFTCLNYQFRHFKNWSVTQLVSNNHGFINLPHRSVPFFCRPSALRGNWRAMNCPRITTLVATWLLRPVAANIMARRELSTLILALRWRSLTETAMVIPAIITPSHVARVRVATCRMADVWASVHPVDDAAGRRERQACQAHNHGAASHVATASWCTWARNLMMELFAKKKVSSFCYNTSRWRSSSDSGTKWQIPMLLSHFFPAIIRNEE